jgi:hypothetical protein
MMPGKGERDPLDDWLDREISPLPPPSGTFELITKRARRRKLRKLAVTVTSAAAVAVATVFAVPAVNSLHLGQSTISGTTAANGGTAPTPASRSATEGTNLTQGTTAQPNQRPSAPERSSPTPQNGTGLPAGAAVPPNFQPTSVTFIGPDTGWVIGPGGTSGSCANANPTICMSVVRTQDGGQSWRGIPAPDTNDVTGIRFLNQQYGWAYGPQLWSTQDGGQHWNLVNTGTQQVIDLETAGSQAYALFATCAQGPSSLTVSGNCSSYTLETSLEGSGNWSDVGQATSNLPDSPGATPTIVLSKATGWLLATDG